MKTLSSKMKTTNTELIRIVHHRLRVGIPSTTNILTTTRITTISIITFVETTTTLVSLMRSQTVSGTAASLMTMIDSMAIVSMYHIVMMMTIAVYRII